MSRVGRVGTAIERWCRKVRLPIQSGGCWEWIGAINSQGYGSFAVTTGFKSKRIYGAHRWGYSVLVGPVPSGETLDHLCRNRWCVNPDHLEVVTNRVNILRGVGMGGRNARKTNCPLGHNYSQENTIVYTLPSGKLGRRCRICTSYKRAKERAQRTCR